MEEGLYGVEIAALLLVGSGFVATNLDNLVILVGLLGARASQGAPILVGYGVAALSVLMLALLGGLLGSLVDPALIGYLGILPLSMGLYQLYRVTLGRAAPESVDEDVDPGVSGGLSAFTLMASNSGDSVALFVPLFAESGRDALIVEVVTYLAMILLWAGAARFLAGRRLVAMTLNRYGAYLVPVIMISVGIYILLDTATDTLG